MDGLEEQGLEEIIKRYKLLNATRGKVDVEDRDRLRPKETRYIKNKNVCLC